MSQPFIHDRALCESSNIGPRTHIWAFAHILPGAAVGADCNICDGVFIENDVVIGNRVTIKCGVQVWNGITIQDDVFVGPNATFTNDRFPRSKDWQEAVLRTVVEFGASIGANATILPGVRIGRRSMIGAGAVVTRDVPPFAIVVGNPARISGYVDAQLEGTNLATPQPSAPDISSVGGCRLIHLPHVRDMRGDLTVAEFGELPFQPQRQFVVSNTSGRVRGEHAHRECAQLLICVSGEMKVLIDDGTTRSTVRLASPHETLLVPAWVWAAQYDFSPDSALLVLASHPYDPTDYIRDYEDYLTALRTRAGQPTGSTS